MNHSDIQARYELACALARDAGALALTYFRRLEDLVIESKGVQDEVSIADREVEVFIRKTIAKHFPDDGLLGEEGGDTRNGKNVVWVIDPIDGTACFVNALFSWCISIAVVINDVPVIGAVFDPNAGELFHALHSKGAYVNEKAIKVKPVQSFKEGVLGVGFSHRSKPEEFGPFMHSLLSEGGMFIRNGSGALMICYVAAGRLIGYFEPHINSWDCLAGIVIVRAAGGQTNEFLENEGMLKGNPILAAGPTLYLKLLHISGAKV